MKTSFRPLFGVSLFLLKGLQNWNVSNGKFSSPLRGISISTVTRKTGEDFSYMFSSPLRGISISTLAKKFGIENRIKFSSPLRGISISTNAQKEYMNDLCFRPLYGVSLFLHLLLLLSYIRHQRFRPLYGVSLFLHTWKRY